jgi:replicative DNA helicase
MGKTALAQWIFENIAQAGHDVLYINLEMAREQLLARSLSRIAWKYEKKDFSALEVLRGYAWTDEQREAITEAAARYKADIAPHFIYNPDGVKNNIDSILTAMEAETARLKAQGKPAPLVCVDYLQIIETDEGDETKGLKTAIKRLKDFAIEKETVVFLIIANNRASNKTGTVEMESGRDTSAIEYSGDFMLGLAYTAIEDRREYEYTYEDKNGNEKTGKAPYDLETIRRLKKEAYEAGKEIPAVCTEVSLKVLKSRFTEAERRANLIFDGKHSTFNQIELKYKPEDFTTGNGWTTYEGKNPFEAD